MAHEQSQPVVFFHTLTSLHNSTTATLPSVQHRELRSACSPASRAARATAVADDGVLSSCSTTRTIFSADGSQ